MAAVQHHLPHVAQLVEEALQRQPRVILTHLQSPLGVPSRRVVPRSSKASGKKAKHPALAGTPRMLKTSLRDSMTPRKCKKMVVC